MGRWVVERDLGPIDKNAPLCEIRRLGKFRHLGYDFEKSVIATFRLPLYYDFALSVYGRPTDRPTDRPWTCVTLGCHTFGVTLRWMGWLVIDPMPQTRGIDVTRRAESIGDGPSS